MTAGPKSAILVIAFLAAACHTGPSESGPQDTSTPTSTSTPTTAPATTTTTGTTPPTQPVATVVPVRLQCSAEVTGFGCDRLIDGLLRRDWQAPDGGVGATVSFWFDVPYQIVEIGFTNQVDPEQFLRNARIKGMRIAVDDLSQATIAELDDTNNTTQWIPVRSLRTSVVTITVTSAYPGVSVGESAPFAELALAEITVHATPVPEANS